MLAREQRVAAGLEVQRRQRGHRGNDGHVPVREAQPERLLELAERRNADVGLGQGLHPDPLRHWLDVHGPGREEHGVLHGRDRLLAFLEGLRHRLQALAQQRGLGRLF